MADSTVADIRLRNLLHRDRRLHPHGHRQLLQCIRKGEGVHHRGQHAHMICARTIHFAAGTAAPKIAAADDQSDFNAHVRAFLHGLTDVLHRIKIDTMALRTRKHLTAEF